MAVLSFFSGLRSFISGDGNEFNELWKIPETESEIENLIQASSKPLLFYKHSFACGVCVFSKSAIEAELEKITELADPYFIDVRASRDLSNKIAELTGVKHESPQVIIVKDGEATWHASHGAINLKEVFKNL